jgi:hypothetical protein
MFGKKIKKVEDTKVIKERVLSVKFILKSGKTLQKDLYLNANDIKETISGMKYSFVSENSKWFDMSHKDSLDVTLIRIDDIAAVDFTEQYRDRIVSNIERKRE